jgi:hypothetical protein
MRTMRMTDIGAVGRSLFFDTPGQLGGAAEMQAEISQDLSYRIEGLKKILTVLSKHLEGLSSVYTLSLNTCTGTGFTEYGRWGVKVLFRQEGEL